jgi:S-adenosylmethionine synthetase
VSQPRFGGGSILEPIEIFLAGRATLEVGGEMIPVAELAVEGSRTWLRENLHALDAERHVVVHPLVRPGSQELVELYDRAARTGEWLANDTSCGVGYAPLSVLERVVDRVERTISAAARERGRLEVGEDVKVMGVRGSDGIGLTVGCAFIDRHLRDLDAYLAAREAVAALAREGAAEVTDAAVAVVVNAADDPAAKSVYLTVTGLSAESGDDGEAGRGNRANGLITPGRPMTMESLAGKNPVTHVGKLYNLTAGLISESLIDALPEVAAARCLLVSRIGHSTADPQIVDVRLRGHEAVPEETLARGVEEIVRDHLAKVGGLWEDLIAGSLAFDRWPFRA